VKPTASISMVCGTVLLSTVLAYTDSRAEDEDRKMGAPHVSVKTGDFEGAVAVSRRAAQALSERFAGVRATREPELVAFTDQDLPFLSTNVSAWVVPFQGFFVPLPAADSSTQIAEGAGIAGVTLNINLVVNASSGQLLCVYSKPEPPPWPGAALNPEGDFPRRLADIAHVEVPQETPTAPVRDILVLAWKSGLDLPSAKQIVARPAHLATRFPAKVVGEGTVPVYPPGNGWIVSGLGLRTNYKAEQGFYTQFHVVIDDRSREFIAAFPSR